MDCTYKPWHDQEISESGYDGWQERVDEKNIFDRILTQNNLWKTGTVFVL